MRLDKSSMSEEQKKPKPLVARVRDSEARSIEVAVVSMPGGLLKP